MERPRLLCITTIPETLNFFSGQLRYLRSAGMDVHVLSSPGVFLGDFSDREGVTAHTVQMHRNITPFRDLFALLRIIKTLRRIRPDIVHAHTPKGGLLGMAASFLTSDAFRIYHIHGLPYMTATGFRRALLRGTEKISCRLANEVLCVSPSIRDFAIAEGLCRPEKIGVLRGGSINGVDAMDRFNPEKYGVAIRSSILEKYGMVPGARVVGFVGRIVRDKGLEDLIHCWRIIREEFPDVHLLVVGPFEPRDPVPAETEKILKSDHRIHLVGVTWDTPPLYKAMDLLVLPTYREGFPVVPLEAAAMGLPVVATQIHGCVDAVVDGVTGTLVPPHDPPALCEALRQYLLDPELLRRHGRAGRERVLSEFRPESIWKATCDEYLRVYALKGRLESGR